MAAAGNDRERFEGNRLKVVANISNHGSILFLEAATCKRTMADESVEKWEGCLRKIVKRGGVLILSVHAL